jgi:hypothetical protein
MSSLDALNGPKPNPRGRGRGRGGLGRARPQGGPGLPVNSHAHPVFVPQATRGNRNAPGGGRGRGRGALPLYDADYLDHNPSQVFRSKGGGLGFHNFASPNLKPGSNGGGRWDPATRPLLKPIKFVRAKERLFEADPDELLQAHELKPHSSQCSCVWSSLYLCQVDDNLDPQVEIMEDIIAHDEQPPREVSPESGDEAIVEETNIEIAARAKLEVTKKSEAISEVENGMEGVANGPPAVPVNEDVVVSGLHPEDELHIEISELLYSHFTPQVLPGTSSDILVDRATELAIGGLDAEDREDDEIILYPSKTRSGTVLSPPSAVPSVVIHEEVISVMKAPTLSNDIPINILTSFSIGNPSTRSTSVPMRMRKEAKRTRRIERNKQKSKFFDREEMRITGDVEEFIDGSPRVGDSDLEWGSDGPAQVVKDGIFVEKGETSESEDGGMDIDEGLDEAALARFAMSVTNPQHLGIYDLESAEESDEENDEVVGNDIGDSDSSGSESSEDGDEWTDEDEDEEDQTPDVQWQSKLMRMREKVQSKQRATAADDDEDYLAYLEVSRVPHNRRLDCSYSSF